MRHDTRRSSNKVWYIAAFIMGATIISAGASTPEVSQYFFGDSWVKCLEHLGKPSSYAYRKTLAEADTHSVMREGPYRGTAKQNIHMLRHSCPKAKRSSSYGKKKSRESYETAKSSQITWEQYNEIAQAVRDTARRHGVDEKKALQIFGCESGFYPRAHNAKNRRGVDRGIAQINSYHHPDVTDEQAYNWRWSIGWAIRNMKVEFVPKKGKYKGQLYSRAAWWVCWSDAAHLGYGIASIRAKPNTSVVASISD